MADEGKRLRVVYSISAGGADMAGLRRMMVVLTAFGVTVLAFVSGSALTSGEPGGAKKGLSQGIAPAEYLETYKQLKRVETGVPLRGTTKVVILTFEDYQCPACAAFDRTLSELVAFYAGRAPGLVTRERADFPLNSSCNTAITVQKFVATCEAAAAVRLAGKEGKADDMRAWLYAQRADLTPGAVVEHLAQLVGDPSIVKQVPATIGDVRESTELGRRLGVRVTPTVLINGVKVPAPMPLEHLKAIVEYELGRSQS